MDDLQGDELVVLLLHRTAEVQAGIPEEEEEEEEEEERLVSGGTEAGKPQDPIKQ